MLNIITRRIRESGIYVMQSPSGKYYLGQCVDFDKRMGRYKRLSCPNQKALLNALKCYGFDAFKIDFFPYPEDMLDWAEVTLIAAYGSYGGGYNLTEGGANGRMSDETKKKISKSLQGNIPWNKNNGGYKMCDEGKRNMSIAKKEYYKINPMTNETKKKISESLKGREISEDLRIKLSLNHKGMTGMKHSDETKNKFFNGNANHFYSKKHSPESKEKMRNAKLGKKKSAESIRKRTATNTGKTKKRGYKLPEETRAKMREAHARRKQAVL